jgi:hypothetical protein
MSHMGAERGIRDFRKHTGWYMTGYPVGSDARRTLSMVSSFTELEDVCSRLDRDISVVPGGERLARGHTNGPIKVVLPHGYLDNIDDITPPEDAAVTTLSGG